MPGCLIVVLLVLAIAVGCAVTSDTEFHDPDDPNTCYYEEPIPHYDACR